MINLLTTLRTYIKMLHLKICKAFGETLTNLVGFVFLSFLGVYGIWIALNTLIILILGNETTQSHPKSSITTVTAGLTKQNETKKIALKEPKKEEKAESHQSESQPQDSSPALESQIESIKSLNSNNGAESSSWDPFENLNPVYDRSIINSQKPQVYVIVSNVGLREDIWKQLQVDCPQKISISFSPHTPQLAERINEAKQAGFGVLVDLPLESQEYLTNDTGPLTLLTGVPTVENLERYENLMKMAHNIDGVMGDAGDRFLSSDADLKPILAAIHHRHLFFVDPQTTLQSRSFQQCKLLHLSCHTIDLTINEVVNLDKIDQTFTAAAIHARENGFVIVRIHATPVTITQLQRWIKLGEEQGLNFKPLSHAAPNSGDQK